MQASIMACVRLAEARIGAVSLGVPIEHVVQAIAPPDTVHILPRRQGALWGVVEHLGAPVPVVDLARWVDVGARPDSGDDARILILREGLRTIGLRVDAVGGMVDVAAQSVARLHHDDDPDEVFQCVAPAAGGGKALSVLEVGRLADLASAWTDCAAGASDQAAPGYTAAPDGGTSGATAVALLEIGAARLAVPSASLAEVIPMPPLAHFGVGIEAKYCLWRNRHLPVLSGDVLHDIAFDAGTDGLLAVIEHDGLALGLPVGATLELRTFGGAGLAMPDGCTSKFADADGNAAYLLDTASLFARVPEAALSRREEDAAPADDLAGGRVDATEAHIVFEAGGLAATPISAVAQVLDALADTAASGTIDWHGRAISVIDLRPGSQEQAHGAVLVVQGPRQPVGFLVTRVHTLVPASSGSLYQVGSGAGKTVDFIHTGSGSDQASYRIVDLMTLAA